MDHYSKGHALVIYCAKERWVMSASQRARPAQTDRDRAKTARDAQVRCEAGRRRFDRTRAQSGTRSSPPHNKHTLRGNLERGLLDSRRPISEWLFRSATTGGAMPIRLAGRDGQEVTIPDGHMGLQGKDGHMVAVPPGHVGFRATTAA